VQKIPVRTLVVGGMPGWQIALIAIAAALLAATAAVLAYRAWTIRGRDSLRSILRADPCRSPVSDRGRAARRR
jgi:hypothetical protein